MSTTIRPFLMFEGHAQEAMDFYVSHFPDGLITDVQRYGAGEMGKEGSIKKASFTIGGQTLICIDSPVKHAFTFTPSFSLFVECASEEDIHRLLFRAFVQGGSVLMPLNTYGFSRLFGWVNDRFGVSWQLNWA